jgi:hypothetical protein
MDHISTAQLVLGVTAAFTIGLGVGAAFAVLMLQDSLRAIREERALIDQWDRKTSTDLMDRLADPEPEPDDDPPPPAPEVIVPTAADICIVDNRGPGLHAVLAVATLMGALMERNQQGPVKHGRHAMAADRIAYAELVIALKSRTAPMPVLTGEVA